MKEIWITDPPDLDPQKQHVADMHSVINIISVLAGVLTVLETKVHLYNNELHEIVEELSDISALLVEKDNLQLAMDRIRRTEAPAIGLVKRLFDESSIVFDESEIWLANNLSNLESIYQVTMARLDELAMRAENPNLWIEIEPDEFQRKFEEVFYAIEKNANGLYRIHFNLALKEKGDYYLDLKVESIRKDKRLHIPLRLIDVLRDLTANARKYTDPGGKVALAVFQDEERIRCRIEDTGRGIPEDELDRVVEFGYRASNARNKRTMGGGFGLTKAAWLVLGWKGQFKIASEPGTGTSIFIIIPNQPDQ